MPSTDDPGAIDGLTYSGAEWRRMDVLGFAANGSAGAMATGIRPGDPGLAVSLAGSVVNVSAGVAVLYHTGTGAYRASFPTAVSPGSLTAADPTNPRVDLVYLRVWDNAVDGTGLFKTDIVYLAGTAAVSPVAPTPGALEIYIPLATVSVPKSGGGSPSVSATVRPVYVAPGGIAPSASAAGTYAGQYRDTGVAAGTLQRYNGTVWQDLLALAAAGQVNIGASPSTAAFAAILATSATQLLASRVITTDSVDRFKVTGDGTMTWGPGGSTATDTALTRSGTAQLALTGALAVSNGISVPNGVGSRRTFLKSADTSRASNTTYTDDAYFVAATMTLEANATYAVDGFLRYAGAAAGSGDMKFLFTGPSGWSMFFGTGAALAPSTTNYDGTAVAAASGRIVTTNGGTSDMAVHLGATIITSSTSGGVALQWAQNTSSATATILRGGSWLRLERIA